MKYKRALVTHDQKSRTGVACLSFGKPSGDTGGKPRNAKMLLEDRCKRVRLLGPGGGYVFATIHNIQPDIPPETLLAVYDTVAAC